jgi:hypothetical protein
MLGLFLLSTLMLFLLVSAGHSRVASGLISQTKIAVSWDGALTAIQIGQQKSENRPGMGQSITILSLYDVLHCPIGIRLLIISQV